MKKTCAYCGSDKWGLVRYYLWRFTTGQLQFNKKACKEAYMRNNRIVCKVVY